MTLQTHELSHMAIYRKSICTLLLLLTYIAVYALSGQIVDIEGNAITGAAITDRKAVTYSGEDGSFYIKTIADSLFITRVGFQKLALNTKAFTAPIVMQKDEITLPPIWVRAVEYKPNSPSLGALVIHPDTNARVESASELLLSNPSFSTTDIRLSGERQTVSLLGSLSRHSLVMLDGVVLNSAGEAFDFSKIPLGQISHIEVIKGNSSVYGGSAAIGGIIHIHTRQAAAKARLEAESNSTIGSYGLYKQTYSASLRKQSTSVIAEYSHQVAQNDFEYDTPAFWNEEPHRKRVHNRKVSDSYYLKGSYFAGGAQVDYSVNAGTFIRQLPGPINFLDLFDDSRLTGGYTQQNLRGLLTQGIYANELLLWWNTDRSTYQNLHSTNPFAGNHYRQKQTVIGVKTGNSINLESTKLAVNAEHSAVDYSFKNLLNQTNISGDRQNSALSLRGQQDFYPSILRTRTVGAVRADYSDEELHPTWRIEQELGVPVGTELLIGGYVGTAFSQPSLFDMYWIGDSETHGNPDLKNEESFGYNLYADLSIPRFQVRASYYQNWIDNLIQWRQYYMNGVSWKPFNVGSAETRNYELEARGEIGRLVKLSSGITFTEAFDLSKNEDGSPSPSYKKKLVYTPDLKAMVNLSIADQKRGVSLQYNYTGKQYSTPDNLIDPLKDFDNLDAAAHYRFDLKYLSLKLDLKINNILNKRYEVYSYTPQPGINWSTGITLSARNESTQRE